MESNWFVVLRWNFRSLEIFEVKLLGRNSLLEKTKFCFAEKKRPKRLEYCNQETIRDFFFVIIVFILLNVKHMVHNFTVILTCMKKKNDLLFYFPFRNFLSSFYVMFFLNWTIEIFEIFLIWIFFFSISFLRYCDILDK